MYDTLGAVQHTQFSKLPPRKTSQSLMSMLNLTWAAKAVVFIIQDRSLV